MIRYDVIVIGGGAAGLMCAFMAARRGRRVALLEHQPSVGRKIAISGGGRCNFTNLHAGPQNYISAHPNFCKSALARYTPADFVALVESHGIAYHEKKLGQLFCDGSSRAIIDMLLAECAAAGVEVHVGCRVDSIRKESLFHLAAGERRWECESLVIACGGLSFSKLGASDFGYRIAEQFGLRVIDQRPGLVPLTLSLGDLAALGPLSGMALPVAVRSGEHCFREAMLFTHRGLSGPAILQISSYWNGAPLHIDLLPEIDAARWLAGERARNSQLAPALATLVPRRFAETWCELHAPERPLAQFNGEQLKHAALALNDWRLTPAGTEGYPKAEVTCGGVDTAELSSRTMEARKVAGLFFIGEVVDVTGWLGGYNFQWAWASAHAAGQAV